METVSPILLMDSLEVQPSPRSHGQGNGRAWSPVQEAQSLALPIAAPGPTLGGFLLCCAAQNLCFARGVFSQAACLDDDPPQSPPSPHSKMHFLGGWFLFLRQQTAGKSLSCYFLYFLYSFLCSIFNFLF